QVTTASHSENWVAFPGCQNGLASLRARFGRRDDLGVSRKLGNDFLAQVGGEADLLRHLARLLRGDERDWHDVYGLGPLRRLDLEAFGVGSDAGNAEGLLSLDPQLLRGFLARL